jgi:hypothetical protein
VGRAIPHHGKLQQNGEATRVGRERRTEGGVLKSPLCKDIYEVLRQKEIDLDRVRQEVDALALVIPLVEEDGTWHGQTYREAGIQR